MRNTRDMIAEFQRAFGRPIHDVLQTNLSPEDRLLLGSILLEEVVETVTKGLGLQVVANLDFMKVDSTNLAVLADHEEDHISLEVNPEATYDPIETADGLGDTNVVIHFAAHWAGMNLDKITEVINDSNMSKLASDGTPIINGVTQGYRAEGMSVGGAPCAEIGYRADLPIGKILKGPNFYKPDIAGAIGLPTGHVSSSTIRPEAALDHCAEHPDQTSENCAVGYGLAGGGVGMYYMCNICGSVFGKTDDGEEF